MFPLLQNTAGQKIPVIMKDSAGAVVTGKSSATVTLSKAGGALGAANDGTFAELGGGLYTVTLDATDSNTVGPLVMRVVVADCVDSFICCSVRATTESAVTPADGSITAAKIGADAITSDKIADGAIGADQLAAGAITAAKIADDAITAAAVKADAVTKIQNGLSTLTAQQVWEYATRTLSSFGSLAQNIWEYAARALTDKADFTLTSAYDAAKSAAPAGAKMDIVDVPNATALTAVAVAVWSATTRTLSSFGSLVADTVSAVWSAAARTLTDKDGFSLTSAYDPAKTAAQESTSAKDATVAKASDLSSLDAKVALDATVAKDLTVAKDATVAKDSTVAKASDLSSLDAKVALDSTVAKDATVAKADALAAVNSNVSAVGSAVLAVSGKVDAVASDVDAVAVGIAALISATGSISNAVTIIQVLSQNRLEFDLENSIAYKHSDAGARAYASILTDKDGNAVTIDTVGPINMSRWTAL